MTAPTDAPVEERHRRAAGELANAIGITVGIPILDEKEAMWVELGVGDVATLFPEASRAIANAERDGRASRDAEVAELSAYRRAWERMRDSLFNLRNDALDRILAEELARKVTP